MSDRITKMIEDAGGKIDAGSLTRLPDGSGFFTASFPLPKDHWSCVNPDSDNVPPMPFRMKADDQRREAMRDAVRAAGKYAYRCATMNGKEPDLDPDALLQNLIVGLFGYHTEDGLSQDNWSNPNPVPELWRAP